MVRHGTVCWLVRQGRTKELEQLRTMLAMLHTFRAGGTIIMVGERGSGKTFMVSKLRLDGELAGMQVMVGQADYTPGEAKTASGMEGYKPWHGIMAKILERLAALEESKPRGKPRKIEAVVREIFERQFSDPHRRRLCEWAPEVNCVVGRELLKPEANYKPPPQPKPPPPQQPLAPPRSQSLRSATCATAASSSAGCAPALPPPCRCRYRCRCCPSRIRWNCPNQSTASASSSRRDDSATSDCTRSCWASFNCWSPSMDSPRSTFACSDSIASNFFRCLRTFFRNASICFLH